MHRYASTMPWKNICTLCATCGQTKLGIMLIQISIWIDTWQLLCKGISYVHITVLISENKNFFLQDSTKLTCINKLYTEIGSFLFKSLTKTFVSLLEKLLANFPQEHLRRIQIVCRSMFIFVIKWICCIQVLLMHFFTASLKQTSELLCPSGLNSAICS